MCQLPFIISCLKFHYVMAHMRLVDVSNCVLDLGKKRKSRSPMLMSASKRKRVSFGANLSPELFDKRLPPGTPIRKGSAPRLSVGRCIC